MTVDEASGPPVDVWPEHMPACNVFIAMGTQWRIGANGATGLDYGPLQGVMRLMGVPRKDWPAVFDDLRVIEGAAIEHIHEKR